ncbi:MAG: hypothetical protein KatS3mg090_0434 [Patescibacteria group bacterium]|nr:MAG: hypothetical protein KatS3mg090_0434 [Patescibacteria group bacterium]
MAKIVKFIEQYLAEYKDIFVDYSSSKREFLILYKDFVQRGKGVRGASVFLTDKIFKHEKLSKTNLYYLAAFFELMHSNLLIHDDFMYEYRLTRNAKTINFYFESKFKKELKKLQHLGNSLAVNLGDTGFFLVFDFFNRIKTSHTWKKKLFYNFTSEYTKLSLAQADDVFFGQTNIEPNHETIKRVYLHKTARYTFVLPVISTLYLRNNYFYKDQLLIRILENLGVLFQITDDLIGFLSDQTGKDKGLDIRVSNKTIVRYFLIRELKNLEFKELTK